MPPQTLAKMIASKYGVNPADFLVGKNGTIVYQPKRTAKPKPQTISKPENMSVEEYKEKFVIPMNPDLKDLEDEEWRPVPNKGRYFGGEADYGNYYEISNLGRLRTINLQNAAKSSISCGYDAPTRKAMQFHLNHKSGMNTCPDVKYMVADAFLGEHDLENNMVVHIDGDYHNNRADNLKWVHRKKKGKEMNINNIANETVNRTLRESFETKYENAIDTIEYYLNMCSDGHQLSQQQCEQLSNIVDWLKETDANDNPSTPEWIKAAEEILNQCQPQQIQEKSKSGIEINPENKGKFTATMKRTGKSAEELSHSKNPLTRKRAQFALNSRKWNKKKNANESTIGRIIKEELENMSAYTDTQNARPKWMDILDAINAAGVNHAPKTQQSQTAPKPESEPMQQQAQQTEPETQQPKASANEYQIGKYTFNPYTHTLIGPNGTVRIRPQYSNILNALCQNMGEEVELAKMFNITDDRKMRVALSMMRKLFADDSSVKIQYYGGKGKLVVNQEGLNESEETEDEGNDYFGDFVDVLEQCGWAYYNFQDVQSKSTGKTGTRFSLDKYNANACTAEELKERILQTIPQQYVVFGNAQHKYAPELNKMTVVILDA
jgi:DNA-binding winged helix-turn-helix (wHTH) protein